MRTQMIGVSLLLGGLMLLLAAGEGFGQNKGGKGQGGFGGLPGMQFLQGKGGSFSFNPLDGIAKDPARMFEMMSRGRGYVLISEIRSQNIKDALTEYAQKAGISGGQLNRDQFVGFGQDVKTRLDNGTLKAPTFQFGGPGQGGMAFPIPQGGGALDPAEAMKKLAEDEFKRRDTNGDGILNRDEMPEALKNELAKWDKNRDNLIDQEEFRAYFNSRLQGGGNEKTQTPLTIIIDEDDLDQRPTVFRAGNLPKGLPQWFAELDTDKDGQVALWEWRRGGKPIEEFSAWDRNEDGFITAEEVLRNMDQERAAASKKIGSVASASSPSNDAVQGDGGNFKIGKNGGLKNGGNAIPLDMSIFSRGVPPGAGAPPNWGNRGSGGDEKKNGKGGNGFKGKQRPDRGP